MNYLEITGDYIQPVQILNLNNDNTTVEIFSRVLIKQGVPQGSIVEPLLFSYM